VELARASLPSIVAESLPVGGLSFVSGMLPVSVAPVLRFLVGASVRHFGSLGTPVALTALALALGWILIPFAAGTRGRPLPA